MAATAVIYQPARTAMQQGRARTKRWVLEWKPAEPRLPDPLMGWIGSGDTRRQVQLRFESKDAAIEYAKSKGIDYVVREPKSRTPKTKSYADNFRW